MGTISHFPSGKSQCPFVHFLHTPPEPSLWTHSPVSQAPTSQQHFCLCHLSLVHPTLISTHCGFPKILGFPSPHDLGIKHSKTLQLEAGQVSTHASHLRPELVLGEGLRVRVMESSQWQTGSPRKWLDTPPPGGGAGFLGLLRWRVLGAEDFPVSSFSTVAPIP